ncbi:hypothetical protein ALC62_11364 [Cyphomyrmex costatus]|uniref:Uncharacterized protein n=1 Tax=Cyphomyrmex costatus TaxID=456900 RepID=A0A195CD63_9HYME|nr:hypothetical protein ALC62_11364 [Cyphomyrmex costatus]
MAWMTSLRNSWLVGQRDSGKDRICTRRGGWYLLSYPFLPTLYDGIRPVRLKAHPDFHPHPPFSNDSMTEDGR